MGPGGCSVHETGTWLAFWLCSGHTPSLSPFYQYLETIFHVFDLLCCAGWGIPAVKLWLKDERSPSWHYMQTRDLNHLLKGEPGRVPPPADNKLSARRRWCETQFTSKIELSPCKRPGVTEVICGQRLDIPNKWITALTGSMPHLQLCTTRPRTAILAEGELILFWWGN